MVDDGFAEVMKSNTGCAVIMAGSDSDVLHIDKIVESLRAYEIPYEVRICSAHKQPDTLLDIIKEYNSVGGSVAYVAVAGGTDALSGTLSFHALGPVISCPPDSASPSSPNISCLTNPPGSSNCYIARPENVGKFIAQVYAGVSPGLRLMLAKSNEAKVKKLEEKDAGFRAKYHG
jgi:5-(carboxyamino)imidazole ribonucleotide mutase